MPREKADVVERRVRRDREDPEMCDGPLVSRSRAPRRQGSSSQRPKRHVRSSSDSSRGGTPRRRATAGTGSGRSCERRKRPTESQQTTRTCVRPSRSRSRYSPEHTRNAKRRRQQHSSDEVSRRFSHRSARRRRRETVSQSSDSSSVASRSAQKVIKSSKNEIEANQCFSIHDVMELIKSLPSTASQSQNHFSMSTNAVPEFDPANKEQTIDLWISKVEQCAALYKWSEIQQLHYALPKLSGIAKVWYQGLPSLSYSWVEWKDKLTKAFPTVQNYAQLLHEMLDRKVRINESLETYFYNKMNLLNRCDIKGKRAVDCIIYGLEDKGMRLGAQAANYSQPEELLSYFKSIKTEDVRDRVFRQPFTKRRPESNHDNSNLKTSQNIIKCFNCNEMGHPSFKCNKPLLTCTICKRVGHQSANCRRLTRSYNEGSKQTEISKPVSEVKLTGELDNKYVIPIKVNSKEMMCYVDLGSQSTLIRISDFKNLNVIYSKTNLPTLKGFGNSIIEPLGRAIVEMQVQSVVTSVEVLVVPDELLKHAVLLGHTFTEQAGIIIIKTDEHLVFQKDPNAFHASRLENHRKINLIVDANVHIASINAVPVETNADDTVQVYVKESLRKFNYNCCLVLPGLYEIVKGKGHILVANLSNNIIQFSKGQLLTRCFIVNDYETLNVRLVESEKDISISNGINTGENLANEDKDRLEMLLMKYRDCFSFSLFDLGLTNLTQMSITLKDVTPVVYRPYRLAYSERNKVKEMVQDMLDSGIITESTSSYASPIILVQKKTGDQRLCVDYRALNAKTVKEHYPMPRIEDQIDQLGSYEYFITLDLASGYYQIPISASSQDKTAFVTPDGQYQFTRMPFGLANAPSIFQRTMNTVLKDVKGQAFAFMDDIIIPAHTISQGMQRLEIVLKLIREAGLTLKLSKCLFFCKKIDYLGFEISKQGVRPGSKKTAAVEQFKCPTNQHEVRQFIGLASFFRRFVKDFAIIANPLTKLLKKDSKWIWGHEQEKSFNTLKSELVKRPILALYNMNAKTQIHTDACKLGIAGILLQEDEQGRWRAVAYYSRQTTVEEQKYHSFELETLAVIASLQRFRVYVLGIKFTIITDCSALRTTLTKRDMIPRIGRWWLQLQEYDCSIEYRPGNKMTHVDALSRNAIPMTVEPEPIFDILVVETEDWLTTIQGVDEEVQRIKSILEDPETPKVHETFQNYRLKGGKVYRVVDSQLRWLVPKGFRWQLLKRCHDDLGHFGLDKTLDKLKSLYWFPKMNKFTKKYVQSCLECSYHKIPPGKRQGMLHPISKIDIPFHTIHIDHLGPFVRSRSKNTYLLVVVEAYTKYVTLFAVRNTKTKSTIKVLNQYFSLFGVPNRIISDRGTSFTSKSFKEFVNKLGIKHVLNAVATPRANGQVERYNRTILASLAIKNHNCKENEWDRHLEEIQLGLNTTLNKGTGKTPAEVLFGVRLRTKSDGMVTSLLDQASSESSKGTLQSIRQEVNDNISENQTKQKERFDKNRKIGRKYQVGDLVRIEKDIGSNSGQSRKLLAKLQGPYRIVKVLDKDRYVVQDTPLTRKNNRKYEAVVAIDKIHPWLTFTRECLTSSDEECSTENVDFTEDNENSDHIESIGCLRTGKLTTVLN